MSSKFIREPPEGVLAGEDVPPENDRHDLDAGLVDELAKMLGQRPGYRRKSLEERREIAREKLEGR